MRLTTKIKLKATVEQKFLLKETLKTCSEACNYMSAIAFLSSTWNRIDLQKLVYYEVKEAFGLSAQMVLLCVHKTANDYHSKNLVQRRYGERSAMPFDERVLTIFVNKREVSI